MSSPTAFEEMETEGNEELCLIAPVTVLSDISEIIPDNVSVVGNSSRQKIEVDKIVYLSESLYIYPKNGQSIYNDTYKITINRNNAADICTYSVISKINQIPWEGIGILHTKLYYNDIPIMSPEMKSNLTAEIRIKNNFNTNKNIKLRVYKCKDNEKVPCMSKSVEIYGLTSKSISVNLGKKRLEEGSWVTAEVYETD